MYAVCARCSAAVLLLVAIATQYRLIIATAVAVVAAAALASQRADNDDDNDNDDVLAAYCSSVVCIHTHVAYVTAHTLCSKHAQLLMYMSNMGRLCQTAFLREN